MIDASRKIRQHPPFEAIIFDHDGTLVDTETPDFEACRLMCQEQGLTLSVEDWAARVIGRMDGYELLYTDLLGALGNGFTREKMWQRLRELWPVTLQDTRLLPGVTTLLPQLQAKGYPLGVATAAERTWVERWLTHFELRPYFQIVATGDDVTHNKPAPDVYLHAARQLGVAAERCLVFEDSVAGMQAAKAAGMTVVVVLSHITTSLDFSLADAVIPSLNHVTADWLDSLGRTYGQ